MSFYVDVQEFNRTRTNLAYFTFIRRLCMFPKSNTWILARESSVLCRPVLTFHIGRWELWWHFSAELSDVRAENRNEIDQSANVDLLSDKGLGVGKPLD